PAATVVPLSKNLGFVAVGAYGLIASLLSGLFGAIAERGVYAASPCDNSDRLNTIQSITQEGTLKRRKRRAPSLSGMAAWSTAALLLLMHGPGALAGRVLATATV